MRIKDGFILREICGENIIIAEGKENLDFSKILSMNESASFLWNKIGSGAFDETILAEWLVKEYDVSKDSAINDSIELIDQWRKAGIIAD